MDDLTSEFDLVLQAFWLTIQLAALSGVVSVLLGTVLAAMRVGPVAPLRVAAATYVNVVRNTPLLIVFVFVFVAFPNLGLLVGTPFLLKGVLAVSFYTAPFVAEAIRAGINAVPLGQAEAARAIGLTFGQTMGSVILPQAFRAVVPPLASVLIAMTKNTSIAAVFGIVEATARMRYFTNNSPDDTIVFLVFAAGYIIIVELLSVGAWGLERRWRVAR
ncbi:amino acid ABC transporter permease [Nocardioides sp. SOB77]|uniref:Amino acid ABC transporter permease n=1 Tax=Nocardioides oceani TaxID=3058369 RepID=A0ABT8FA80_9ACTN|nr:amino acid ABC transporter permease [Nocardioides oceani]MDN4171577.1 amino acid ABC transporter permease [Nocardioides oceani]